MDVMYEEWTRLFPEWDFWMLNFELSVFIFCRSSTWLWLYSHIMFHRLFNMPLEFSCVLLWSSLEPMCDVLFFYRIIDTMMVLPGPIISIPFQRWSFTFLQRPPPLHNVNPYLSKRCAREMYSTYRLGLQVNENCASSSSGAKINLVWDGRICFR